MHGVPMKFPVGVATRTSAYGHARFWGLASNLHYIPIQYDVTSNHTLSSEDCTVYVLLGLENLSALWYLHFRG